MDAFIGEIRMFSWSWVPQGWLACDGSTYALNQYQALYAVLGITYGGTANVSFKVPNIQCCAPIGVGQGPGLTPRVQGPNAVGATQVTINYSTMPTHNHTLNFAGSSRGAPGNLVAVPTATSMPAQELTSIQVYSNSPSDSQLANNVIGNAGAAAPAGHNNMQPLLAVQFCICFDGMFPVSS